LDIVQYYPPPNCVTLMGTSQSTSQLKRLPLLLPTTPRQNVLDDLNPSIILHPNFPGFVKNLLRKNLKFTQYMTHLVEFLIPENVIP